jgi:hypothetical protein
MILIHPEGDQMNKPEKKKWANAAWKAVDTGKWAETMY